MTDLRALAREFGDAAVYADDSVLLLCSRWEDVIDRLPTVDAVITDPPYLGAQRNPDDTHFGGKSITKNATSDVRTIMGYLPLDEQSAADLVLATTKVCAGWAAVFNDYAGAHFIREAFRACGWSVPPQPAVWAKPRAIVMPCGGADTVQKGADFIASARPRGVRGGSREKRGVYTGPDWFTPSDLNRTGGKPLPLMRDVVSDYSRPSDLILDPCCGGATTLLAARLEGRKCIGVECDPETAAKAATLLQHGRIALRSPENLTLDLDP